MPLPTDRVQNARTFRQCAKDPLGTGYHEQAFALSSGSLASFKIERGAEGLIGILGFSVRKDFDAAVKKLGVFHGSTVSTYDKKFFQLSWTYDVFGDTPFSALLSGNHRDLESNQWGTSEVFFDSIDEVRRVLDLEVKVEKQSVRKKFTFGGVARKLMV